VVRRGDAREQRREQAAVHDDNLGPHAELPQHQAPRHPLQVEGGRRQRGLGARGLGGRRRVALARGLALVVLLDVLLHAELERVDGLAAARAAHLAVLLQQLVRQLHVELVVPDAPAAQAAGKVPPIHHGPGARGVAAAARARALGARARAAAAAAALVAAAAALVAVAAALGAAAAALAAAAAAARVVAAAAALAAAAAARVAAAAAALGAAAAAAALLLLLDSSCTTSTWPSSMAPRRSTRTARRAKRGG